LASSISEFDRCTRDPDTERTTVLRFSRPSTRPLASYPGSAVPAKSLSDDVERCAVRPPGLSDVVRFRSGRCWDSPVAVGPSALVPDGRWRESAGEGARGVTAAGGAGQRTWLGGVSGRGGLGDDDHDVREQHPHRCAGGDGL
jgi:hypothetical protein